MESTVRSHFDIIESLPASVGEFAQAAYKARESGAGGSGDALGRVVLLRLLPDGAATDAVRAASERYASLPMHPNILTYFGLADSPDGANLPAGVYAVSEWARGITLKERIRRVAPFSLAVALDIAISATQALLRAQAHGLEHGDLRPEDVLLSPDGQVKVADFAIGRAIRELQGLPVAAMSSTEAVARLLFEMLTAQQPSMGRGELSPKSIHAGVPVAVDGIVRKAALAPGSGGYSSLAALLADLQTAREDARAGKPLTWSPLDEAATVAATAAAGATGRRRGPLSQAAEEIVREQQQQHQQTMPAPGPTNPGKGRTPRSPIVDDTYYDDDYPPPPSAGVVWLRRIGILLGGLAVVAIVFLCAYFALLVSNVPSDVTVPSLIGKQLTDAQTLGDQRHFKVVEAGHDNSDTWPQGAIYQQTPMAGRMIKSGKEVSVFVSDGPRLLDVPDLSQMTVTHARAMLQDSGLPVGSINEQYDPIVQKGIVMTQEPAAGSKVSRDRAINLTVSKGPPPPPAPGNLSASSTVPGEVDLAWDEVPVATVYDVYRDGKKIAAGLPETTYSDVGLDPASTHSYTVTAVNANGESPQAQAVTAAASPGTEGLGAGDSSGATGDQAATDQTTAPPTVATGPGAPKQRQFEVKFRVPRGGKHNIQVQVQDATGTNTVYDEARHGGDRVDESFQGFGNRIIIRIFIDGKLVKQQTK